MIINRIKYLLSAIYPDYIFYKKTQPCLKACEDKLSKKIIKAHLNYHSKFLSAYKKRMPWVHSPYYRFHKRVNSLLNPIYIIERTETITGKSLVVFGEGDGYRYTKSLLSRSDWRNNFRCIANDLKKLETIQPNEVLIIASTLKDNELRNQVKAEYPNIQIYEPPFLWATMRNQYLNVFAPVEEEYAVDCGPFDGRTEEQIYNWGGGKVKKIYAFELDPLNKDKCLSFYKSKGLSDVVTFINKGTSDRNESIMIENSAMGTAASRIGSGGGSIKAEIAKLDDEIAGRVTFIKMDIEGAELSALKGAYKIITSQKPRLAICIYHKKDDIFEIPSYLLSIVPEYKFIVRHYSSNSWETVLYAYIPNKD